MKEFSTAIFYFRMALFFGPGNQDVLFNFGSALYQIRSKLSRFKRKVIASSFPRHWYRVCERPTLPLFRSLELAVGIAWIVVEIRSNDINYERMFLDKMRTTPFIALSSSKLFSASYLVHFIGVCRSATVTRKMIYVVLCLAAA